MYGRIMKERNVFVKYIFPPLTGEGWGGGGGPDTSPHREQRVSDLDKAGAGGHRRHELRRRCDPVRERAHIGDADRIREIVEHRRVVGRVADEHEALALRIQIDTEFVA